MTHRDHSFFARGKMSTLLAIPSWVLAEADNASEGIYRDGDNVSAYEYGR